MNLVYTSVITAIMGSTLVLNGSVINVNEILGNTWLVANQANIHQIATVLEIYYLDHGNYPAVSNAEDLANVLYDENYIKTKLVNPEAFEYIQTQNGNDYSLKIK